MAIVFTNATVLLAGYNLTAQANRVALEYSAEALDNTVFGSATRTKTGGLKVARATVAGFWSGGVTGIEGPLHDNLALDDEVLIVFPEAIAEGATSTGSGYMFKTTQTRYRVGGAVGDLFPFEVDAEGRGVQS